MCLLRVCRSRHTQCLVPRDHLKPPVSTHTRSFPLPPNTSADVCVGHLPGMKILCIVFAIYDNAVRKRMQSTYVRWWMLSMLN